MDFLICTSSQSSEIQNRAQKFYHFGSTDGNQAISEDSLKKPDVFHYTVSDLPPSSLPYALGQTEL